MPPPGIQTRRRLLILLGFVALAWFALSWRLAYWQITRASELSQSAEAIHSKEILIRAPRGDIVDRRGWPLASNKTAESIFAVPKSVPAEQRQATAATLSQILGLSQSKVYELITKKSSYVYIKRKVTEEQAATIKSLRSQGQLKGIDLEPESERYYPEGSLAAHVLGFAGIDSQGLGGIEYFYDRYLKGENGAIEIEYDALGHEIIDGKRKITPARPGYTLFTTIDTGIQQLVERHLMGVVEERGALKGAIMIMDVKTGGMLAMAQYPTFDPNSYGDYDPELWRNWAVADAYHPGSIFKPVTASALLEEEMIRPTTPWNDAGCIPVPGWPKPICNWNHQGFGSGTFRDVVVTSSNTGFARVGMMLGADRFYKYLERFNLTAKTGLDLPGEGVGQIPDRRTVKDLDLAVMGFGQTLTVTPLAMLAAVNAVANDGTWVQPHIMQQLRTPEGEPIKTFAPITRQVTSPETAREMQEMMVAVVSDPRGTGKAAAVPGYRVGGKTGTAEKCQGCNPVKYIASFVGFAPVPEPKVTVLITVHEPQGVIYGGQVAAPIFQDLVADILRYLEFPPETPALANAAADASAAADADADAGPVTVTVPTFINQPVAAARALAERAGLALNLTGAGPLVTDQEPGAGLEVAPGSTVTLAAEISRSQAGADWVSVPLLTGLTVRQAAEELSAAGLQLRFDGSGAVARQEPGPGVTVPRGTRVHTWLQAVNP